MVRTRMRIADKNEDRSFKIKLSSKGSDTFKPKMYKAEQSLEIKGDFDNNKSEEIYYDDIIYYDGGGVEGYGY